ncbi:MAG: GTPase domain-containing protein [bacterium]|nr:GTPase domain-containing protein [bacterium]
MESDRVTLSLVSHTNVGKTTLARTLLRRDVGEVRDEAHVTQFSEGYSLIATPAAELRLWDTPGFGDSVRLLARLRRHDRPVAWFLTQLWDRVTDRPLWCSQQAALNIRDQADVVLYLVNAAEEPEEAGYVAPELELLGWIGRPVVVLLNQTGEMSWSRALMSQRLELWRRRVERFEIVVEVAALDAFSRCWVQEDQLFERIVDLLPESRRPLMRRIQIAWTERNLGIFARSLGAMAGYLTAAAADREALVSRKPDRADKRRAMCTLGERLEGSTAELTAALLAVHGLEGRADGELRKQIDAFVVEGEDLIDPQRGALVGGVLSGAVAGLAADLLAGGLSFGGGLLAGAILGALGGAGLAKGYEMVRAGTRPAVGWSPAFLDQLAERTLLRYLAIAHFGRGRGEFQAEEEPQRWRTAIAAALRHEAEAWTGAWKSIARDGESPSSTERIQALLGQAAGSALVSAYPEAAALLAANRPLRDGD